MNTPTPDHFTTRLSAAGMSPAPTAEKAALFARAAASLPPSPTAPCALFVPGRLEVLGKHTDYAGGRSLLATVQRGFCFAALPRPDNLLRIRGLSDPHEVTFPIARDLAPTPGHWSNYPMTVARRLARNFPAPPALRGADIIFVSDLPPAAGMSSSSAFLIGIFHILAHFNALADRPEYRAAIPDPLALAAYLATIENGRSFGPLTGDRGVGTFGGSEDHTAILCCRPNTLSLYSFCPARLEQHLPMPPGLNFIIASSGVLAEKTGRAMARYNRASLLISEILQLWNRHTHRTDPSLADALRSAPDAPDRLRKLLADSPPANFTLQDLLNRLDHFLAESQRIIPAAVAALASGNLPNFGRLVDESQRLAEQLLQNQIPQTIDLARFARAEGALAASAFGAGFGGSVWALVPTSSADSFLTAWQRRNQLAHPADAPRSTFFPTTPGPALLAL